MKPFTIILPLALLLTGCVVNTDWPERASWPLKLAATSQPSITPPVTNPPVALSLKLNYPAAGTNKFYFIQVTTSLVNPNWKDFDGPFTVTIPPCGGENITNNGTQQYFRTCCR